MNAFVYLVTLSGFFAQSVTAALVAYYPMDDIEGRGAQARGPMLTPVNLTPDDVVPGRFGNAVQFTAFRQTMLERVGDAPVAADRSFGASFWVNADGAQNDLRALAFGSTDNTLPLVLMGTSPTGASGQLRYFIRSDPGGNTATDGLTMAEPFDRSWHHIAWSNSGSKTSIYIDGVLDTVFEFSGGPTALNTLSIGGIRRVAPSHHITAKIDEVSLWDEPLSEDEIIALSNGVSPVSIPEPSVLIYLAAALACFTAPRRCRSPSPSG